MAGEERRRQDDDLILTMHGNIQSILAHQSNIESCVETMCAKLEKHDERIGKTEGSMIGMKWVGGIAAIVFTGFMSYLGVRK